MKHIVAEPGHQQTEKVVFPSGNKTFVHQKGSKLVNLVLVRVFFSV
jgi:hypothetical protein